ncbi:MAG: hypothetical protein ACRDP7_50525 [Trebonia sp.]
MFELGREGPEMREETGASANEVAEFYNLLFGQDDDLVSEAELYEEEDDEGPFESLLRHAAEIEAGLRQLVRAVPPLRKMSASAVPPDRPAKR